MNLLPQLVSAGITAHTQQAMKFLLHVYYQGPAAQQRYESMLVARAGYIRVFINFTKSIQE